MKKAELLIPVGNKECLLAAIHNGADAVYLGGKKFGARAYANNFDEQELIETIKLCHLYNVKIYVTVNTMIYNEEIKEVTDYLHFLYSNNVDAVIMQDIGLINVTRKILPNLEIHVSTQAHNHNQAGIDYYKELGCTRVVFDRESSLEAIKAITTPIEKEIFVYGALCVCYSGNCLFSALNGTRSANRGMCVGSCRLPYKLYKNGKAEKEGFLLSTKDLNTTEQLKEILDAEIDSLKIEGRMKSKEYVAIVTKTYRKLIDAYYNKEPMQLTEEEKENLLKTYNREFTKGYLFNAENIINGKTSNHQGIKIGKVIAVNNKKITIELTKDIHQEDAIRFESTNTGMYVNTLYNEKGLLVSSIPKGSICIVDNKERIMVKDLLGSNVLKTIDSQLNKELSQSVEKKIPLQLSLSAHINQEIILEAKEQTYKVQVIGKKVEKAISSPTSQERIKEQLSKLGNTPFSVEKMTIDIDENIFINIKELNELRREAIEKLIQQKEEKEKVEGKTNLPNIPSRTTTPKISILVRTEGQLRIALANNIDYIYTPNKELYTKYKDRNNIYFRLNRIMEKHPEYRNEKLVCTELGSIIKYGNENTIRSDYYLNIANDYSINTLIKCKCKSVTLSVECTLEELQNIKNKEQSEILIYGTPECMIIKKNIFQLTDERAYLEDNKKQKYPLQFSENETHVFQHEPINLIDKLPKLKGFGTYRIELLEENEIKTQSIITQIKDMI